MDYNNNFIVSFILIGFAIVLIPFIFFLITQQNTLKAIRREHRTMSPGEVWLQLIPLFQIVWSFVVVNRIADSIRRELNSSHSFSFENDNTPPSYYQTSEKPTQQIGTAWCVLNVLSIIPVIGTFTALASLVCWIIYWVKLSEYKNIIQRRNYTYSDSVGV